MPRLVKPQFIFLDEETHGPIDGEKILKKLERCGRVCYKSEEKITPDSARRFIKSIIKSGHESVIEHVNITVIIVCDRGVSHEIVRHRLASYSQESTRYCDYAKKGTIAVIEPFFFEKGSEKWKIWEKAMLESEKAYNELRALGAMPQEARSVLPNSLKTEIAITYNLREWRHFFKLRCPSSAHPQMREITIPLLREFQKRIPIVFDDIGSI